MINAHLRTRHADIRCRFTLSQTTASIIGEAHGLPQTPRLETPIQRALCFSHLVPREKERKEGREGKTTELQRSTM